MTHFRYIRLNKTSLAIILLVFLLFLMWLPDNLKLHSQLAFYFHCTVVLE